jgi:hypothetical protein
MIMRAQQQRPVWWPRFTSPLRSTALTARLGRAVGIAFGICFLTGMISHYQYHPWLWLPLPAAPVWGYRLTQGVHVATGIACLPLVLIKLWSVYPNLFRFPPLRSLRHAVERFSVAVLIGASLVQLVTGVLNVVVWYAFGWDFVPVHYGLAWVVAGSVLLHVAVKLPDIAYGLRTPVADGDVLTEVGWEDNPAATSNAGPQPPPPTPGLSRRGVLAVTLIGIGAVTATTVGQTLTPLRPLGLLAIRQPDRGPQGVPVNRTAAQAGVLTSAVDPGWTLTVRGPTSFRLGLGEVEAAAQREASLPIACVEGWSVQALWRGLLLLDLVQRAGGGPDSVVRVRSLEPAGFTSSQIFGPQVSDALLATHVNGERLDLDHGYPLRLIAPNRAGVLNTKWLTEIEVLR